MGTFLTFCFAPSLVPSNNSTLLYFKLSVCGILYWVIHFAAGKEWKNDGLVLYSASNLLFVYLWQKFLCRSNLASDLKTFASENSAPALVMMFLHTVPNTDNIIRELIVYSTHRSLQQQVSISSFSDFVSRYYRAHLTNTSWDGVCEDSE